MDTFGMWLQNVLTMVVGLGIPAVLVCLVAYRIVKAAVKHGMIEAFEQIKEDGRL